MEANAARREQREYDKPQTPGQSPRSPFEAAIEPANGGPDLDKQISPGGGMGALRRREREPTGAERLDDERGDSHPATIAPE